MMPAFGPHAQSPPLHHGEAGSAHVHVRVPWTHRAGRDTVCPCTCQRSRAGSGHGHMRSHRHCLRLAARSDAATPAPHTPAGQSAPVRLVAEDTFRLALDQELRSALAQVRGASSAPWRTLIVPVVEHMAGAQPCDVIA